MPFALNDFHDFVRLLAEHPEWRTELRRLVLSDELLALPDLVRELVAAQGRAEERLSRLEEAHVRLETTVAALAEAQRRTEAEIGELRQAMRDLVQAQQRMTADVAELKGWGLQWRYRERAPAYFGRLVRAAHTLSSQELATQLEEAETRGLLTDQEVSDLLLADLVVRGRRREDGVELYLVVEVSWGIGADDVKRAAWRAGVLGKVWPTLPVVAGEWATPGAKELAAAMGVWQVLDGRVVAPQAP